MIKNNIKTFLFDIGNVLVDVDYEKAVKKLRKYTVLTQKQISMRIKISKAKIAHEKGSISDKEFFLWISKELQFSNLSQIVFEKIWTNTLSSKPEMTRFIQSLKEKGYKIFLLSDTSNMHNKYANHKYKAVQLADKYFPSFKLKCLKSEGSQIFSKVIARIKIKPENIIFVDDVPVNVKNAKKAGLNAILFKGLLGLKKGLKTKYDLLI